MTRKTTTFDISAVKIERGIPVTARSPKAGLSALLNKLQVGESFLLPHCDKHQLNQLVSAMSYNGARWRKKFAMRTVDGGVRVWLIGPRE